MRSVKRTQDILFGVVIIFVAIAFLTQSMQLPKKAGLFPTLILYFMLASGVGLIFSTLVSKKANYENVHVDNEGQPYISKRQFLLEFLIPGAILLGSTMLIRVFGFFICTFIIVFLMIIFQDFTREWKLTFTKHLLFESLGFAFGTAMAMYLFFALLLAVPTPKGIFGF